VLCSAQRAYNSSSRSNSNTSSGSSCSKNSSETSNGGGRNNVIQARPVISGSLGTRPMPHKRIFRTTGGHYRPTFFL
jgi:hypothetical protein